MSSTFTRNDIARARQDEGAQPYKDNRDALNQEQAHLQAEAEQWGEENLRESDEERSARLEEQAEERLAEVGDVVARQREKAQGDDT